MSTTSVPGTSIVDPVLAEAVAAGLPSAIADLSRLVRIPSVSWAAFDPAHVQKSAEAVAELATQTGVFESVTISRAKLGTGDELGQPAVLATRKARNGKPTILLYAHHDVQPPGKDEEWETSPFEPTVKGDRLYGRGTADDKAGVVAHIAAIRALVDTVGPDFDLGLALFIEGEEEWGSGSFANFLEQHREELSSDVIVVADSDNWDVNTPSLTVALRGAVAFNVRISTLAHASHSGMFGGAAPDAMLAAIQLLATLHDENGSAAVDGLKSRRSDTPEYPESTLVRDAAFLDGVTPVGTGAILDRLWNQPAITVTGIDVPDIANASNTLIPSVRARISARIAPGQTAQDAYEAITAHLEAHVPFGAHLEYDDVQLGNPFLVDTTGPAVALAKEAMTEAWGNEPLETGIGGSIPFIADLVEKFPRAEILVTGVEDPDTRAHSPNESLHLGVFKRAIHTEAILLAKLNAGTLG